MGSIVNLHEDPHRETQLLLPWYAAGRLDPPDREMVEAHLAACGACQEELRFERKLSGFLAELPVEADAGWAGFRSRLGPDRPGPDRSASDWRAIIRRPFVGWAVAAQLALVIVALVVAIPSGEPPQYRTLGSVSMSSRVGNIIVMFRPETTEDSFRRALTMAGAELVGGPTSSSAYVLHVSPDDRSAALARLRSQPEVMVAEPIDPNPGR